MWVVMVAARSDGAGKGWKLLRWLAANNVTDFLAIVGEPYPAGRVGAPRQESGVAAGLAGDKKGFLVDGLEGFGG